MKLVLIITDYGSFNNFLSELACQLISADIELHIICSKERVINITDKEAFDNQKITFHFVNIPRNISISQELKAAKAIRNVIDIIQPDLAHIHFTTAAFPALIFKKSNVPYWATFHGLGMNSSSGLKKLIFSFVEMFSFMRLKKIFTVNNKDTALAQWVFSSKVQKYNCFGFGCDISQFDKKRFEDQIQAERQKYNISPDDFVIAYTGRFVSFKGFHLVIKSFKVMEGLFGDKVKLILIGGNDPIHSSGLDEVENKFLSSSKNIINIGYTREVARYLALSNLFLFPSLKEGLPTCILEALSMGIPVVTFDARGNNDVVQNNYNGVLIKSDKSATTNVNNIVGAIRSLMLKPDEYKRLSQNALGGRKLYSRQRFIDQQLQYYEEFEADKTDQLILIKDNQ